MKLCPRLQICAGVTCLFISLSAMGAPAAEDLIARMNESLKDSLFNVDRLCFQQEQRGVTSGDIYVYDGQGNLKPGVNSRELFTLVHWARDGNRTVTMRNIGADSPTPWIEHVLFENGREMMYWHGSAIERSRCENTRQALANGTPYFSQFEGQFTDEWLSVSKAFASATSLTVGPETEVVDGAETFVVEAVTPHGKVKAWLDPAGGCLPRRYQISKEGEDLYRDKPLNRPVGPMPEGEKPRAPWEPMKRLDVLIDSIGIVNVGGTFCLAGWGKYRSDCEYESGKRVSWIIAAKNDLNLDPDPAVLAQFFELNIPDGTSVRDAELPDAQLSWLNGEIVPLADNTLRNVIEEGKGAATAAGQNTVIQAATAEKATPVARPRTWWWVAGIAAVLVGVAVMGLILRRRL